MDDVATLYRNVCAVLRPGTRIALSKAMQHGCIRPSQVDLIDTVDAWLCWWVARNLCDYKRKFLPAVTAFVRTLTIDPDCYIPLVIEPEEAHAGTQEGG